MRKPIQLVAFFSRGQIVPGKYWINPIGLNKLRMIKIK